MASASTPWPPARWCEARTTLTKRPRRPPRPRRPEPGRSGQPLEHRAVGADGEHRRHHGDAVLAREVGSLAHVHAHEGLRARGEAALPLVALGAERMGE